MGFEEDFRTALLAPGVAALVGDRATWAEIPQAQPRPLICLWGITGNPDYTMDGPNGLWSRSVQVDCWAERYAGAKALARAVIAALPAIRGTIGATDFQGVFVTDERDMPAEGAAEGDTTERQFCVQVDLEIWFGDS